MRGTFLLPGLKLNYDDKVMRPGTDSLLLGAWASKLKFQHALDLGCGMGIIGFMLAAINPMSSVLGVDFDVDAFKMCLQNKQSNPELKNIHFELDDFLDDSFKDNGPFDLLVMNPPYFLMGLESPNLARKFQRHWNLNHLRKLSSLCSRILSPEGQLRLVLPVNLESIWCFELMKNGFCQNESIIVRHLPSSESSLCLLQFSLTVSEYKRSELVLKNSVNSFTEAYRNFLDSWYLDTYNP
ncbi:MAG: methyltransferase [Saprospiraceae bacterium]|nr:methyltransferase [Saprospiraceae bacterium]